MLLWLDDIRDPSKLQFNNYIRKNICLDCEITWVKNYDEFVEWIQKNGLPDIISFDHDLADEHYEYISEEKYHQREYKEKTGYDCAKWLVDYCIDNSLQLPKFTVHSQNPVGAKNINSYLTNFLKQ